MGRRSIIQGIDGRAPLNRGQLDVVLNQFAAVRNRLQTLVTHDVTQDDLLVTLVKREHREMLTNAATLVKGFKKFSIKLRDLEDDLSINIFIREELKFLLPNYALPPHYVYGSYDPNEAILKLKTFAQGHMRFMQEYYVGVNAIQALNHRCNNLAQMRFFLKSLPALGIKCEYKVPSNMPNIPKELREALRRVDEFVARASLLNKDVKQEEKNIELSMSGVVRIPCPWYPTDTIAFYL